MLFFVATALARCASGGIEVHEGPIHAEQGFVVVEFAGSERSASSADAHLVGPNGRQVDLDIVSTHRGNRRDQLVLRPVSPLDDGTWRVRLGKTTLEGVLVATHAPAARPMWTQPPVVLDVNNVAYGCGPAVLAKVEVGTALADRWIQVELQGPQGTQRARVSVAADGMLSIGHGMCGGLFDMEPGAYEAELNLLSSTGRQGATHTVSFEVEERS